VGTRSASVREVSANTAKAGLFSWRHSRELRGIAKKQTLFVGLFRVVGLEVAPDGLRDPLSDQNVGGYRFYTIKRDRRLSEYIGRLAIDWKGMNFVQRATKDKRIIAIHQEIPNEPFPGFARFHADLDDILSIPDGWKEILRNVKGVYLLVCKETGKLYVGSAKGTESLWGRFQDYARTGHGGNLELKRRGRKPYRVSVLEIVNSDVGIELIEEAWKQKLMSVEFGLNLKSKARRP